MSCTSKKGAGQCPDHILIPELAMPNTDNHDTIVRNQFTPRAQAYLSSAVHAQGEDLDQMVRLVGKRPDALALDMGCGGGHASFRLAPLVHKVVAYDLSESMLAVVADEARRQGLDNVLTKQGAAESLACPSASFDVVVSRYSAHHWHDLRAGLAQMRRVLKPEGLALFMDVITPGEPLLDTWLQSLELLRDPSHVRNASLSEWHARLSAANFTVTSATALRLRLDFALWVARMATPESHVLAIRSLQERAGSEVAGYFAFEEDGSFTVDTALISAEPQ